MVIEASADGDICTTNMEHKECGDRDDQAHYEKKLMSGQVKQKFFQVLAFGGYNHKELYYMWHPCFCNIQCSGSRPWWHKPYAEYKADKSMMKDTAKNECESI